MDNLCMYELTKREELLLLSILRLRENAYIVSLRKHIKEISGKAINYGSLCNTLSALTRKGFIQSKESIPMPKQGGRRKVLYFLTDSGKKALKQAYEIQKLVWDGLVHTIAQFD